jgi:LPXTG-site transpeptidase (sortase) family protein
LIGLGVALLLLAAAYLGLTWLNTWVQAQDRSLRVDAVGSLEISDAAPAIPASAATDGSQSPAHGGAMPTATFIPRTRPTAMPGLTPIPQPSPTALPPPPVPVQIRIPAVKVTRSIVELAPTRNAKTGTWTLDVKSLFRRPGKDLVGHWVGSSNPGQEGNMILVGHNYGYGYNGVFVDVGRLKAGQVILLVNEEGETFSYKVTTVQRLKWSKKNEQELMQHQAYLEMGGPERLTLVTCGGATWEPFPDRVYVVAEPVH